MMMRTLEPKRVDFELMTPACRQHHFGVVFCASSCRAR
jgi:hypothetical protein